jgi:UDP-N-acetylmuramoyl-L-alanyl-D-glutamate--2,6-diaminopimelate ligase
MATEPAGLILLTDLLAHSGYTAQGAVQPVWVTGLTADSRRVQPGFIFVAWQGASLDGHQFIGEALKRGAAAVVGSQDLPELPVPYIQVDDSRRALAELAAAAYGHPGRKLTVIGVTGTDGKTTTTNLIYEILRHSGRPTGMISTVNAVVGEQVLDTGFNVTTPDAPDVQHYLAQMVASGQTHVVLEATSHGLDQQRVDGCEFDIAVVTNVTHEHLDYHGSQAAYQQAKGRLFELLHETVAKRHGNYRLAVLNRDDQSYGYLSQIAGAQQVSYGLSPEADLRATDIHHQPDGLHFTVAGAGFRAVLATPLVGMFNVYNCLAAVAVGVVGFGLGVTEVRAGVAAMSGIPGRMERIDLGQDFTAVVDFAHTPNAIRRALETARGLTQNRVIAVFGSAGLRDRAKRRLMAEAATVLTDFCVFTAEDPRTESLEAILAEMADGARSQGGIEGETFVCIPDRGAALRYGVEQAQAGDLVIPLGKGHEQSMCFGEIEYPWDDRTALRAALADRLSLSGPAMPYLPTQG